MFLVQGLCVQESGKDVWNHFGKYKEGAMGQGRPWYRTLPPTAWEGLPPGELTGQWVDALGELVLLPGPALELAAEHVAVVFLFCCLCLRRLLGCVRVWGLLGRGCGMTLVTI